jgi:hypothetical protein
MARGWESKTVEDQIQEQQAEDSKVKKQPASASELELHRRREILLLSRVRVQRDLESTRNSRYRDQLTRALSDIDAQLAALDSRAQNEPRGLNTNLAVAPARRPR